MRRLGLVVAGVLVGCSPSPERSTWIAPLDGQTGVPLDAPLQIRTGWLGNPDGYPLPDELVRVVDLADGGFVPGHLQIDGDDLLFVPDAPWRPDSHYAWVVSEPAARARQPELDLPPGVLGEAVFGTGAAPELLDAVLVEGQLCLLVSEPVSTNPWPTELGAASVVDPREDVPELELLDRDRGAGALCLDDPHQVAVGDRVRAGGVAVEVVDGSLSDAVVRRHRLEVAP